jgi:hypothetical protein
MANARLDEVTLYHPLPRSSLLGEMEQRPTPPGGEEEQRHSPWHFTGNDTLPLLEELVRAYSRKPDRLQDVANVVGNLTKNNHAREIFPPEFLETWAIFERAMEGRDA